MTTTYHVWIELERQVDGEPMPSNMGLDIEGASAFVSEDETEALAIANALQRLAINVPEILELMAQRPTAPEGGGAVEWVDYDMAVADWREALDALVAVINQEGAHA